MCPWLVQRGDRSLERPSCNLFPMGSNLGPWDPDWGFFPKCNTLTLMPKYLKTQLRVQRIFPRTAGHLHALAAQEIQTGNPHSAEIVASGTFPTGKSYTGTFLHRKTDHRKMYLPAIATPEFPYTGNSKPEKVRLDIIFAAFNRQSSHLF